MKWMHNMRTDIDHLIEALFSLDEPWQGRFLSYLAQRATGATWDGDKPKREEVANWLINPQLQMEIRRMLRTWKGASFVSEKLIANST